MPQNISTATSSRVKEEAPTNEHCRNASTTIIVSTIVTNYRKGLVFDKQMGIPNIEFTALHSLLDTIPVLNRPCFGPIKTGLSHIHHPSTPGCLLVLIQTDCLHMQYGFTRDFNRYRIFFTQIRQFFCNLTVSIEKFHRSTIVHQKHLRIINDFWLHLHRLLVLARRR